MLSQKSLFGNTEPFDEDLMGMLGGRKERRMQDVNGYQVYGVYQNILLHSRSNLHVTLHTHGDCPIHPIPCSAAHSLPGSLQKMYSEESHVLSVTQGANLA